MSQYMWYLWILTKAIVMLCLSLPTTKAYVGLIGVKKHERAYLKKKDERSTRSITTQDPSNQTTLQLLHA